MTRQDYVLIAKAITEVRYLSPEIKYAHALDELTAQLALALAEDNPKFKASVFFQACEYGKLPRISEVA